MISLKEEVCLPHPHPASLGSNPPSQLDSPRKRVVGPGQPVQSTYSPDRDDPLRKFGFWISLGLIFLRFSTLHEVLTYLIGVNLKLLYVFAPPTLLLLLVSRGLPRVYQGRAVMYWTGYAVCMLLATPFSSWTGGSLEVVTTYVRTELPMLFVIAGLTYTWADCRRVIGTIALSAIVNLSLTKFFSFTGYGRMSISFGTISNSNDLAAHLLLVISFLLFFVIAPKRSFLVRLLAAGSICWGLYIIIGTASRGALIAIAVTVLFVLIKTPMMVRVMVICLVPVIGAVIIAVTPASTINRLLSFSEDSEDQGAGGSSKIRRYLLRHSIELTLKHPVFGVGPGQFSNISGKESRERGIYGVWNETHNVFTQVSSECGIPALIFFVAGIGSTLLSFNKAHRKARENPAWKEVSAAFFCVMIAMIAYVTSITFLNMAYRFCLPAMASLCVAMTRAAHLEFFSKQEPAQTTARRQPPYSRGMPVQRNRVAPQE